MASGDREMGRIAGKTCTVPSDHATLRCFPGPLSTEMGPWDVIDDSVHTCGTLERGQRVTFRDCARRASPRLSEKSIE